MQVQYGGVSNPPDRLDRLDGREAVQPAPVVQSVLLKQLQGDQTSDDEPNVAEDNRIGLASMTTTSGATAAGSALAVL